MAVPHYSHTGQLATVNASALHMAVNHAAACTWWQLMQDEVRKDCVRRQGLQARVWESPVEGPQAGANEVKERPAGEGKPACQAHGLQQLLHINASNAVLDSHSSRLQPHLDTFIA